jgi:hypothetical protein
MYQIRIIGFYPYFTQLTTKTAWLQSRVLTITKSNCSLFEIVVMTAREHAARTEETTVDQRQ